MKWLFTFAVVLSVPLQVPELTKEQKVDLEALQGTWVVTKYEMNGHGPAVPMIGKKFVFKENTLTILSRKGNPDDVDKFIIRLDPSKDPKEFDWLEENGQVSDTGGIYKLDKNVLWLRYGGKERAKEFKTNKDGHFEILWHLKREKSE